MQAIDHNEVVAGVRGKSDNWRRLHGTDDTTTATATTTGTGTGATTTTATTASSGALVGTHTTTSTSIDMTFCCGSKNGQQCPRISHTFDADTRQHITAVAVLQCRLQCCFS